MYFLGLSLAIIPFSSRFIVKDFVFSVEHKALTLYIITMRHIWS